MTKMPIIRDRLGLGSVVFALALSTLPTLPAAAQQPLTPLKVGVSDAVNTVLPLWMAQAGGFFAANGLSVELVTTGGGSRGAQELQAGRLDLMRVGLSSVVQVNRAGGDLRLIASMSNVIRFTFFSGADVKTAADLKGGIVGVSTFGSESDSVATLALDRLGLTRADVTFKEYGGSTQRLAALKAGEIKATAVNEPGASLAREQGVNVLVDLVPEQIPWLFSGVVMRRSDFSTRWGVIGRFLRAAIEGNHLALSNEKLAKAVLAKELKLTDGKIVDISYSDFKLQAPRNMELSIKGAENVIAQIGGQGSTKIEDYVDPTLLGVLRDGGFFFTMDRKYGVP